MSSRLYETLIQQAHLSQLQKNLVHTSATTMAKLCDQYKAQDSAMLPAKRFEQVLLSMMLVVLTRPKPEHMSDFDFSALLHDLQEISNVANTIMEKYFRQT
jgi:hypothetical protein